MGSVIWYRGHPCAITGMQNTCNQEPVSPVAGKNTAGMDENKSSHIHLPKLSMCNRQH